MNKYGVASKDGWSITHNGEIRNVHWVAKRLNDLQAKLTEAEAKVEKSPWIRVEDELPKVSGAYLVMLNYDHPRNLSIHMKHPSVESYFKDDAMWGTTKNITHWQEIELPKGNTDD